MQHATGELENTARLRSVRRDLARALTVARQRGIDPNHVKTKTLESDDG
jgi:large subunit ribosomal protein L29